MSGMRRSIEKITSPLRNRIYLMIGRALLTAVNDKGGRQFVQFRALKGELKDGVERLQEYGFSSHPLAGAQGLFVCVAGNRDLPIMISVDDPRYRFKDQQAGEVVMYSHTGDYIILKNDRTIEINTQTLLVKASTKVRFETPVLECTGDIIDRADDDGRTMGNMREIYNRHVHPENDNGGPTDQPIGGDQM